MLYFNPNYAEAHRNLSRIKKFKSKDDHFFKMRELYLDKNTSKVQLCHINFGLAKAYEDLGDFEQAFIHYNEGNSLRKKLLKYNISRDIELFKLIKSIHPLISKNSVGLNNLQTNITPIFIVGMPRSGTTLVEQIISSLAR